MIDKRLTHFNNCERAKRAAGFVSEMYQFRTRRGQNMVYSNILEAMGIPCDPVKSYGTGGLCESFSEV